MKIGICKECFGNVPLCMSTKIEGYEIYECPNCAYPNGIRNGDFWEIYNSNKIIQSIIDFFKWTRII